jgi:glycosyltransferase involved in cell wall biosynthesis
LLFTGQLLSLAWREKPALIIATHVNFAPVALLARLLTGCPYVVVAHGIDVHPGLSRLRTLALRRADAVWAVSRWTRERVLACGRSPAAVTIIGNSVDSERFEPGEPDPALRRRYGLAADDRILLTVARLDGAEQYKGYDTVLRALPALRQQFAAVRYLIVGTGSDRARVERLAAELGVAAQVTFCGFVADAELADHFRLADVFVMPSKGEGFGIVFLEAMACGTPVIGGDQDGSRDALADGRLGRLVDPDDAGALARELADMLGQQGAPRWFAPQALRADCLALHGRPAFAARIRDALALAGVAG